MPGQTLRASLNLVMASVKARLVSYLQLDAGQVLLVQENRPTPHFSGDQDFVLEEEDFVATGHRDRHDCRVLQYLGVTIRTRLELDEVDRDDIWLTDPVVGSTVAVEQVLDALQNYQPTDGNQNALTFQPMRVVRGAKPVKGREGQTEWGERKLTYEVPLTLPLAQTLAQQ